MSLRIQECLTKTYVAKAQIPGQDEQVNVIVIMMISMIIMTITNVMTTMAVTDGVVTGDV